MLRALIVVLLCSALAGLDGCGRKSQAEQLAALDSAYQSGVLTKEEYDAKKAALVGPVAPAPVAAVAPQAVPSTPAAPPQAVPVTPPKTAGAPVPASAMPKTSSTPVAPVPTPAPTPAAANVAKVEEPDQAEPEPAPAKGCEDAEYKSRKSGPQSRFFPAPVARVKKAALAALATLDFTVHKDSSNEIEASKKRHIGVLVGAGGEREFLRFQAATQGGQEGTRVTGETKKTFVGRMAQKSWTAAVLAQTACNLR